VGFSLAIVAIFVTVTLGVAAGWYALTGLFSQDSTLVRKRVEDEFKKGAEPAARSPLFKSLDLIDLGAAPSGFSELDESPAPPAPKGLVTRLQTLIEQADLNLKVRQLLGLAAALGLALGVAGTVFRGLLLGVPAAAAGTAAPVLYVLRRRKARREEFLNKLPAAFDLMSRVLRSGQSVPQALQAVGDSFEGPIAQEFLSCQKQQNLGLRPEVAFREMAERTGILEMRIFVMAMHIHRQVGGNLSEVLERLASLIRTRLKLRKQVRALTAEGRLQGLTLVALPVLMFGVMMAINRSYAEVLLEHPTLIGGTGLMMGLGLLWIRKIVNFDF
jgi:tight adherence protein B